MSFSRWTKRDDSQENDIVVWLKFEYQNEISINHFTCLDATVFLERAPFKKLPFVQDEKVKYARFRRFKCK